jgi:hypothetical protein
MHKISTSSSDDDWSTIQSEAHDDPPPYDDVEASRRLFGCIQTTLNAQRGGEDEDPIETESMRRFLLYCLASDYRFSLDLGLPAPEREKYIKMWNLMADLRTSHKKTDLNRFERSVLAPYFWKYLHRPCKRLSIPVECAVAVIDNFGTYTNYWNQYKGCVYAILLNSGPDTLANKLWRDRNILIPRLADTDETRQALTVCLTDVAQQYFVSIEGVSSSIHANGDERWQESSDLSCTLTARGKSYNLARSRTLRAAVRDYGRIFGEAVTSCVAGFKSRRSVFPQGKLASDYEATWRGPGLTLTGHPSDSELRSTLPRWRWSKGCHLPDLFEHRPGLDRCDL